MNPDQVIEVNSTTPVSFETKNVSGRVLLMVRPRLKEDEADWIHRDHFQGRRRLFEMQVQLKFKSIPRGHVVMGGQLRKKMNLGLNLYKHLLSNLCLVYQKIFQLNPRSSQN